MHLGQEHFKVNCHCYMDMMVNLLGFLEKCIIGFYLYVIFIFLTKNV